MPSVAKAFIEVRADVRSAVWAMFSLKMLGDYITQLEQFDRIRNKYGIPKAFAKDRNSAQAQGLPSAPDCADSTERSASMG